MSHTLSLLNTDIPFFKVLIEINYLATTSLHVHVHVYYNYDVTGSMTSSIGFQDEFWHKCTWLWCGLALRRIQIPLYTCNIIIYVHKCTCTCTVERVCSHLL